MFQVVSDPEANIFAQIQKETYKEMRKGIINAILHTDVIKHGEMVKELSLLYQMNSETFDLMEPSAAFTEALQPHQQLMLNMILHGADMSNPSRTWTLCKKYSYLILDEFFNQGDEEKKKGIPVQMLNDRDKINRPNSQIGFIEFMIVPMIESMVLIFPPLDGLAEHLGVNIVNWCNTWADEASPPEETVLKVKGRVDKIVARCKATTRETRCNPATS